MTQSKKLLAIRALANLGMNFPECETDILRAIRNVAKVKRIVVIPKIAEYPPMNEAEIALAKNREEGKIPAIREYRYRTNLSLKEAKKVVEQTGLRMGFYVVDTTSGYTSITFPR